MGKFIKAERENVHLPGCLLRRHPDNMRLSGVPLMNSMSRKGSPYSSGMSGSRREKVAIGSSTLL